MSRNYKRMNLNLYRIDVCDLLIALDLIDENSDSDKWIKLRNRIRFQLEEFDNDFDLEEALFEGCFECPDNE